MAAIGQIRKHSGLLIVIVGVALAAFVLGDFLKPRKGRQEQYIGEVAGEDIPSIDFSTKVVEIEERRNQSQEERLSVQDKFQIQQSVWNEMVQDIILGKEYEKLGLTVTPDELSDQILGDKPHQFVVQSFPDQKTGVFNPEVVKNFLRNLDADPQMKKRYLSLEAMVKSDRNKTKYQNLLTKAYYVPKQFSKLDYDQKNSSANIIYVAAKFTAVPDSTVKVTDEDLKKYYNENIYSYSQEATRSLDYVIFDVQPSSDDRKEIANEVNQYYKEFQEIKDVATFVNSVSDERYDSTFKKESELPARIAKDMFTEPLGTLVGPYVENEAYHIAKLMDKQIRPDSLKMSQILISYATAPAGAGINDRTKAEAKALRDSLMAVLTKNPGNFEDIAVKFSDYPTVKDDKGEIGWVIDGQAGFGTFYSKGYKLEVGKMDEMETGLGYHIVKLTEKTAPIEKVRVAMLIRAIEPSSETFQKAYIKASEFAGENNKIEKFDTAVVNQGLNKRSADKLGDMANRMAGVENSRQIIRWAYATSTTLGKVSPVFEDEKKYVVAVLKEIREKGTTPFEDVKEQIRPLVLNKKKADVLYDRINAMGLTDLSQIAQKLNEKVDTANVSFTSRNLPGFGSEYELIGKIFTLEPGVSSGPIKGNNAVFVVEVTKLDTPDANADFASNTGILERRFTSRITGNSYINVMKEQADIVDNRVMFY